MCVYVYACVSVCVCVCVCLYLCLCLPLLIGVPQRNGMFYHDGCYSVITVLSQCSYSVIAVLS
jgi:hypothetical protein